MTIDLKTASVEPLRRTFDHLAAKLGPDKNPSRYQEATWGLQPALNFHYRPTWDPAHELYDRERTGIVMSDFDDLVDPRQYYYGTWTIQRGKQQDSQEKNFSLVEKRELLQSLDASWLAKVEQLLVPLRHVAWGANTNNSFIAAYGYGAPVTSACTMQMMDHLGIAQYITRIGLIIADNNPQALDVAKEAWMNEPRWQPLRELVENSMVTEDWFELFVAQNFVIDGFVYPLVFEHFSAEIIANGGAALPMLTEFIDEWRRESSRWVDAVLKVAAGESAANKALIDAWVADWTPRIKLALQPLAEFAFDGERADVIDEIGDELALRAGKAGLTV